MNHTPGPWYSMMGVTRWSVFSGRGTLAHLTNATQSKSAGLRQSSGENEANARLIAAAPELYDALRALCDTAGAPTELRANGYDQMAEAVELARAALAKVTP